MTDNERCAKHEATIEAIDKKVDRMEKKIDGNGQRGIADTVARNSTWLKVNISLSLVIIGGLIKIMVT